MFFCTTSIWLWPLFHISIAVTSRFSQPPGISYYRKELWGGAIEEEFPLSRKMGWMSSIPLCVLSFCSCWPTCSHTCSVWDPNHPKYTHPTPAYYWGLPFTLVSFGFLCVSLSFLRSQGVLWNHWEVEGVPTVSAPGLAIGKLLLGCAAF